MEPVRGMSATGRGGPERVRGDVKLRMGFLIISWNVLYLFCYKEFIFGAWPTNIIVSLFRKRGSAFNGE